MKKSRYSEHQIIQILKESEAGEKTPDICREYGFLHAASVNAELAQCRTALRHILQAKLGDVEQTILNRYYLRRQSRL